MRSAISTACSVMPRPTSKSAVPRGPRAAAGALPAVMETKARRHFTGWRGGG
jgi:hypothetical protein